MFERFIRYTLEIEHTPLTTIGTQELKNIVEMRQCCV